jgi:hypothetical protein
MDGIKCKKCGELKKQSEFYRFRNIKDGYHEDCKACEIEEKKVNRARYKKEKSAYIEAMGSISDFSISEDVSIRDYLYKLLDQACITKSMAMKEIGIGRNAFYSEEINSCETIRFIELHANDWKYTAEKFLRAIQKSGKTQFAVSEETEIHNVTVCEFLKGRQKPTRGTGNYQAIRKFCLDWMEF